MVHKKIRPTFDHILDWYLGVMMDIDLTIIRIITAFNQQKSERVKKLKSCTQVVDGACVQILTKGLHEIRLFPASPSKFSLPFNSFHPSTCHCDDSRDRPAKTHNILSIHKFVAPNPEPYLFQYSFLAIVTKALLEFGDFNLFFTLLGHHFDQPCHDIFLLRSYRNIAESTLRGECGIGMILLGGFSLIISGCVGYGRGAIRNVTVLGDEGL